MTISEAREQLAWSVDLIPPGASNRPGGALTPTHITIHNTANPGRGADALAHAKYLNGAEARARKVSGELRRIDRQTRRLTPAWQRGPRTGKIAVARVIRFVRLWENRRRRAAERELGEGPGPTMRSIFESTRAFEAWMRKRTDVSKRLLKNKHRKMALLEGRRTHEHMDSRNEP
jgi:hypothetical protein